MDMKLINDEWKRVKKGDVVVIHGDYTQEVYDYICNMYFRHPEKASFNNHIHILGDPFYGTDPAYYHRVTEQIFTNTKGKIKVLHTNNDYGIETMSNIGELFESDELDKIATRKYPTFRLHSWWFHKNNETGQKITQFIITKITYSPKLRDMTHESSKWTQGQGYQYEKLVRMGHSYDM